MFVDTAMRDRETKNRPVRVGVVGAGAAGRAVALQLGTPPPGIRLAGVANRTPANGERSLQEAGFSKWHRADSARDAEAAISSGKVVLTEDPAVLTTCGAVDVIVEATGSIEPAAKLVISAFEHGKH